MTSTDIDQSERLLTVTEVAARLNTSQRFPRRLIDERRIAFVRVGRHVRIPESAVEAYISDGLVEPLNPAPDYGSAA